LLPARTEWHVRAGVALLYILSRIGGILLIGELLTARKIRFFYSFLYDFLVREKRCLWLKPQFSLILSIARLIRAIAPAILSIAPATKSIALMTNFSSYSVGYLPVAFFIQLGVYA